MAEQQAEEDNMNIFVYFGGEQEVPFDVTHVRIDRSVRIIPSMAFQFRKNLLSVETHDDLEKIEGWAFLFCTSLRGIKLPGVRIVERLAFFNCEALSDVEFGDKLETIGESAFGGCFHLSDVELPYVDTIGRQAFCRCRRLRCIAIPLKDSIFLFDDTNQRYSQFDDSEFLTTVDLVGGVNKTISSLLLERWRDEMNQEINRIKEVLRITPSHEKADAIRLWIRSVTDRMEHYKAEHNTLLKEDMTQLELAVWKAKLDEKEESESGSLGGKVAEKAKIDTGIVKTDRRITSGANIIIRNVLPFLQLSE